MSDLPRFEKLVATKRHLLDDLTAHSQLVQEANERARVNGLVKVPVSRLFGDVVSLGRDQTSLKNQGTRGPATRLQPAPQSRPPITANPVSSWTCQSSTHSISTRPASCTPTTSRRRFLMRTTARIGASREALTLSTSSRELRSQRSPSLLTSTVTRWTS